MKILIAEDELVSRMILTSTLTGFGYEVATAHDGADAWNQLQQADAPPLVILDWMMPGLDGVDVCRNVRASGRTAPIYIILLTANGSKENITEGLQAGADDYLVKPVAPDELRVRVQVGARMVQIQNDLTERVHQLEKALAHASGLRGMLPM